MWARLGGPGYHGPGRASGGYPYRGSIIKLRHPPARIPASDIHGLRHSRRGAASVPLVDPPDILYVGACGYLEADWILARDMEWDGTVYIWGVGAARSHRESRAATMFLYYTRGLVRWVGNVHYGDMEVMKAEGQARLKPPKNPGYASTDYCMLAVGSVESGVVGICLCVAGSGLCGVTGDGRVHGGGGTHTTRGPLLLRRMRAALSLGCCFGDLYCCFSCFHCSPLSAVPGGFRCGIGYPSPPASPAHVVHAASQCAASP